MIEEIAGFQQKFNEIVQKVQMHCFASITRDLQVEQCAELRTLLEEANKLKQCLILSNDENGANAMLSFQMLIQALVHELEMWVAFKDDQAYDAWDHLVSAQSLSETSVRIHTINRSFVNYLMRLHVLEQLLFPPQMFLSSGLTVKSSICSICGGIYGECNHIIGRAYMGMPCYQIIGLTQLSDEAGMG